MIEEAVLYLNEYGQISSPYLMRKFKCSYQDALRILKNIENNYSNVILETKDLLTLDGWEKECAQEKKKISKWKDVTKP